MTARNVLGFFVFSIPKILCIFQTMSGLTREIVTLQVGHYANFVGTHCWNIQVNTSDGKGQF